MARSGVGYSVDSKASHRHTAAEHKRQQQRHHARPGSCRHSTYTTRSRRFPTLTPDPIIVSHILLDNLFSRNFSLMSSLLTVSAPLSLSLHQWSDRHLGRFPVDDLCPSEERPSRLPSPLQFYPLPSVSLPPWPPSTSRLLWPAVMDVGSDDAMSDDDSAEEMESREIAEVIDPQLDALIAETFVCGSHQHADFDDVSSAAALALLAQMTWTELGEADAVRSVAEDSDRCVMDAVQRALDERARDAADDSDHFGELETADAPCDEDEDEREADDGDYHYRGRPPRGVVAPDRREGTSGRQERWTRRGGEVEKAAPRRVRPVRASTSPAFPSDGCPAPPAPSSHPANAPAFTIRDSPLPHRARGRGAKEEKAGSAAVTALQSADEDDETPRAAPRRGRRLVSRGPSPQRAAVAGGKTDKEEPRSEVDEECDGDAPLQRSSGQHVGAVRTAMRRRKHPHQAGDRFHPVPLLAHGKPAARGSGLARGQRSQQQRWQPLSPRPARASNDGFVDAPATSPPLDRPPTTFSRSRRVRGTQRTTRAPAEHPSPFEGRTSASRRRQHDNESDSDSDVVCTSIDPSRLHLATPLRRSSRASGASISALR